MNAFLIAAILAMQSAAPADTVTSPEAQPLTPELQEKIVVIAEKMKAWKGGLSKKDDGEVTCVTRVSTGDVNLDAIRCGAMLTCSAPLVDRLDAIMASDIARDEKSAQATELMQSALPCMEEYSARGALRLLESREKG